MRRALLITGADMAAPPADALARLEQMSALYAGLGLVPDLLAIGPARAPGTRPVLPRGIDRFSYVTLGPDGSSRGLADPAAVLAGTDEIALVHLDGIEPREGFVPARLTVYDARDGAGAHEDPPQAGLVLAALEDVRGAARFQGCRSIRLPLPCAAPGNRRGTGGMVGWPGPLDAGLAESWSGVLAVLAARGERLSSGLLLDAAGRGAPPAIPPLLSRVLARPSGYARPVAQRALGLGVLPAATDIGTLHDLTALIALRCPVLTTPGVAARFEDRWHLPVTDEADGVAGWIQGWTAGRDVTLLIEAAEATRAAFVADLDAMTAYTREVLSGMFG